MALNNMRDEWLEIKKCLDKAACKTLLKVYWPYLMFNKPQSISIQKLLKQHLRHTQFTRHIVGIHHHIAFCVNYVTSLSIDLVNDDNGSR